MSVAKEIREEQKQALSTMSTKKKLEYFWEYYKIHAIAVIVAIIVVISTFHHYVTSKEYAFYAILINAVSDDLSYETSETMNREFLEYAQFDPDEYEVYIDTSVTLFDSVDAQYVLANQEKLIAMIQSGDVSAMAADTENFEKYAQADFFYSMDSVMSEDELAKYGPYLYYTDAATYVDSGKPITSETSNPAELIIDHRDPAAMKQPVAVGVILTKDNKIADAGYYAYLEDAQFSYQGYPSDVVLGIPLTNQEPDLVIRFLEYIQLGN